MNLWMLLTVIVAPALFWIAYLYYKDRHKPEPLISMGISYILGYAAGYLCFRLYLLLPLIGLPEDPSIMMEYHRLQFFFYSIGIVGILEEVFKFLPFFLVCRRFGTFDEKIDGIIYASAVALGFASFENLHYLPLMEGFALIGRAFASPLTHTMFASIWGMATADFYLNKTSRWSRIAAALAISVLAHGLFNFFTTDPKLRLGAAALLLFVWIWRIRLIEKLHKSG